MRGSGGRVLMIAHHFPPMGGSGSNRALAFARYLPEYGWRPVVVTPGQAWASPRDAALLTEVPATLRVVRTRSFEARSPVTEVGPAKVAEMNWALWARSDQPLLTSAPPPEIAPA